MRAGVTRPRAGFLVFQRPFRLVTAGRHVDRIAARVLFAGFVTWLRHPGGYPAETDVNPDEERASPRSSSTATSPNAATAAKK